MDNNPYPWMSVNSQEDFYNFLLVLLAESYYYHMVFATTLNATNKSNKSKIIPFHKMTDEQKNPFLEDAKEDLAKRGIRPPGEHGNTGSLVQPLQIWPELPEINEKTGKFNV